MILGKYNQAKTITFDLFEIDGIDLSIAATFVVGDVKIQKNEGVEANTANLPTDEGSTYSLVLTAAEMSAARIRIILIDQTATKVWLDTSLGLETYGNASAAHAFDLDTASVAQTADNDTKISLIPTTPMRGTDSAALASVCTEVRLAELDAANLPTDIAAIPLTPMRGTDSALTDKAGFSLSATGLDAIAQSATGMIEIAKAIWDRVLNGSTHNINNSAGKKLRQLQEAFIVDSGTAQAGAASTITLATTAPATTGILIGDRVTIDSGTGTSEHSLITAYNGTTKVATIYPPWTIVPDSTSTYTVSPASVDVSTWGGVAVTGAGDLAQISTDLSDIQGATFNATTDSLEAVRNRGDAAWLTGAGGSSPTVAQIADGVWDEIQSGHVTAGSFGLFLDTLVSSVSGGGGLTAQNVRDAMKLAPTVGAPVAGSVDLALDNIETDTDELQTNQGNWLTATGFNVGKTGYALTVQDWNTVVPPTAIQNADALLNRDMGLVSDTNSRSPLNALRFLRNKWDVVGTGLTIRKEDDLTVAWTAVMSTDATADPAVGLDPA